MKQGSVIGCAIATGAVFAGVLGTGAANAADIYPTNHGQTTVVLLDHAETVAAAQVGAGNVINAVLGNDRWRVTLESGSRYSKGDYYRPGKHQVWNNVTGQQVVSEAAAHSGGRVAFGITPSDPSYPLWVQQVW
ncbi:hypothetical protein [Williamsia sterculiae]|uniref:Uncharacterized protein n=1 Tax=Williamsia sterculiae TaxID=1344003 RepID=A0A1N7F332_9NOCA|nr:hypothetical protein [Williamsia sterculiae]SIR94694.1 hypothetical protein SAMN05445060_1756 [Williamsia sterculiae]